MLRKLTTRLSYANVMATIAVFVALGGTGYAAALHLPRNSVGNAQLRRHAVTNSKLAVHAVTSSRVKPDSLGGGQINESKLAQVPSAHQADHATTADSAGGAANANTVGGLTAAQLRLSCPSGTTSFESVCVEAAQRPATDWRHAATTCDAVGRHLPTAGEAALYITDHNLTTTEWTGDLAASGTAISSFGIGGFNEESLNNSEPFRCVAAAGN
jgi:hypothetical protein